MNRKILVPKFHLSLALKFLLLWVFTLTLLGCGDEPIDKELVRQAYYSSHLKPWEFSTNYLTESQRDELSRASARVYNRLKESLGEEHILMQEINRPDRDVAMIRVAALKNPEAQACLWAYEMHFVINGESAWRDAQSYEVIRFQMKEVQLNVSEFGPIMDMPYDPAEKDAFDQKVAELLGPVELEYFQNVERHYTQYIEPGL